MEHMATFTVLAKIYSIEYFYYMKVPGLGKIFVQQNFSAIQYVTGYGKSQERIMIMRKRREREGARIAHAKD